MTWQHSDLQAEPEYHSFDVQQSLFFNVPYCFQFSLSLFIVSVTISRHFTRTQSDLQMWQERNFYLKGRHHEYYQIHLGDHPAG